jgi:uncharacterized SAM-binding protein YcdF (DUF218 family)
MMNGAGFSDNLENGRDAPRGRLWRIVRYFLRIVLFTGLGSIAALAGGFLLFYQHVAHMPVPVHPQADGIVVLTGGYQRIDQAVQLLANGAGKRLLISGVNPATTRNHIRLLTRSTAHMFDCCVDIGHQATDTAGNATETTRWILAQNFKSVILVTNNYHMPRSLAELERADRTTRYIPYPVMTGVGLSDIAQNPLVLRTLASEYLKFLLVKSRDWTGLSI